MDFDFNISNTKDWRFSLLSPNAEAKVYDNILEAVGNTPLVKLNKIPKEHGLDCNFYVKCEFMNPGGSIKDRIGVAMIKDAMAHGAVHDDSLFAEPTSGNTGIGIALTAAVMGKKSIIVTTNKNAGEKVTTMQALGSEVVVIKDSASTMDVVTKIKESNPNTVVVPDQFENHINPITHYNQTGVEILSALDRVDMVSLGAGTGGTLSGVSHRIKETFPECIVMGAEPDGSIMLNTKGKPHPYLVEGLGGTSKPITLDTSLIDVVEVVTDEEAFLMSRDLIKKEGILCGGSSGLIMMAAVKAAKKNNLGAGKNVVVILPDGIRNYMSKFVCDQWMEAHLFMDPPQRTMKWWKKPVTDLKLNHKYLQIGSHYKCSDAIKVMLDVNLAIVADERGYFVGAISKNTLRSFATNPTKLPYEDKSEFDFETVVTDCLDRNTFTLVRNHKKGMPTIGLLSRVLDITPFVVLGLNVIDGDEVHFVADGVATGDDLLDYVFKESNNE